VSPLGPGLELRVQAEGSLRATLFIHPRSVFEMVAEWKELQ
jgi:hypothetical protein